MKRSFVRLGRAAAICALLSATAHAYAQDGASSGMAPPKLSRFVEANDPRATGEKTSVDLEIEIDKDGTVTGARVARSAGEELDAAALAAAKQFVFEPAQRDGQPVAARIRYEYVFAAREAPKPPPPPPPAVLSGTALERSSGKPLANADVIVTNDAGQSFTVKTDVSGGFRLENVPPGLVHVTVRAEGHEPVRLDETLEAGVVTDAKLRLDEAVDPEAFTATARVEAPPREVTKHKLEREEMAKVAGTRGDPLRAVELMPGVSRPSPTSAGNPVLRGANAGDSQVFFEGAPVPSLFHLGGFNSVVHSRVLDTVELYPSNFSVRYGRKVGGVIEAKFRDPRTDGFHGIAELSLLDASALVETPVGDKFSVLAAARRSIIDAVLNSAASSTDLAITAAPVYWDYQAIAAYRPTDDDRIRLMAYGSSDRFAILAKNPADGDASVRGAFDFSTVFHRVQAGYRHRWAAGSEQNTELTFGHTKQRGVFGAIGTFEMNTMTVQGRSEWTAVLSPAARIVAGVDLLGNHFEGGYNGVPPDVGEGDRARALGSQRHVSTTAKTWVLSPGAYVEAGLRPVPAVLIAPGVRADYNDFIRQGSIDPRISARVEVTDATALKAGFGRFSQAPDERHVVEPIGNPNLGMTHALHGSAGVEHKVTDSFTASLEGFGKKIDGVVVGTPDGQAPNFTNGGEGRIFGGELLLRVRPKGRFFGFLSYTLMRSERREPGQDWRLFDRDMPHMITAVGVYKLGRGWEVGATVRYTSGAPYTPVTAATYDATNDVYSPRVGRPMSARNPAYSRVDLRIQKTWTFSRWSLAVYLDVQNALNAPNRDGSAYSYDYRQRDGARGLPILPILGLRGEL